MEQKHFAVGLILLGILVLVIFDWLGENRRASPDGYGLPAFVFGILPMILGSGWVAILLLRFLWSKI